MKLMLITGANGQIGSYLAKEYLAGGYRLALLYHRRKERLEQFADGPGCLCLPADLRDLDETQAAVAKAAEHFSATPQILIHCAALRSYDALSLADSDPRVFHEVLDANLKSAYHILRAVLPGMRDSRWGRVVLMGSEITRGGLKQGSAYAAAKNGIVGMMKSLAQETREFGIRVNAISPAPVDTILEEDYSGEYLEFRKKYFAEYLQSSSGLALVSREEIRRVADLLISPELDNLTGQEIYLAGGL